MRIDATCQNPNCRKIFTVEIEGDEPEPETCPKCVNNEPDIPSTSSNLDPWSLLVQAKPERDYF
jgi:hypothetical protein